MIELEQLLARDAMRRRLGRKLHELPRGRGSLRVGLLFVSHTREQRLGDLGAVFRQAFAAPTSGEVDECATGIGSEPGKQCDQCPFLRLVECHRAIFGPAPHEATNDGFHHSLIALAERRHQRPHGIGGPTACVVFGRNPPDDLRSAHRAPAAKPDSAPAWLAIAFRNAAASSVAAAEVKASPSQRVLFWLAWRSSRGEGLSDLRISAAVSTFSCADRGGVTWRHLGEGKARRQTNLTVRITEQTRGKHGLRACRIARQSQEGISAHTSRWVLQRVLEGGRRASFLGFGNRQPKTPKCPQRVNGCRVQSNGIDGAVIQKLHELDCGVPLAPLDDQALGVHPPEEVVALQARHQLGKILRIEIDVRRRLALDCN